MGSVQWRLFQPLYRSQVEAVFRYYLICTGDWRVAQVRTAEIFHAALAWFCPRLDHPELLIPWLWKIALDNRGRRSIDFIEGEKFRPAEIPQSQTRSYACAAQVSAEWETHPHRVTQAMGLYYFGGLEIQQVATLTHMSTQQVNRMILLYGSVVLSDLSSDLYPVGYFSQELEKELEEQYLGTKRFRVPFQVWFRRQTARCNITAPEWMPLGIILVVFIGLTFAAWHSFSSTNSAIKDGPPPLHAMAAPLPSYAIIPIQDNIIVADEYGRIGLLQLETGALTDPISGFRYFPCANPTHKAANPPNNSPGVPARCNPNAIPKPRYPAQFSPDGRWLSITRPIEKDSWILPLDGLGSAQKISGFEVLSTFSPDGHAVAFIDPLDSGNMLVYDMETRTETTFRPLQKGQRLSLAWSPEAVLTSMPRPVQGNELDRWYDSPDGKMSVLVETTSHIHSPCPCLLRIFPSDSRHSWLIYTGRIDALAWSSYTTSLIVQAPSSTGPTLIQIDASTAKSHKIADNLLLIGVRKPGQIESALLHNSR